MEDFNVNLETNHVSPKAIFAVIAIILVLAGSYFYMPKVFDMIFGVKESATPQVTTKADKFKTIEDYAQKTQNPGPKLDISGEQFGRPNPFITYK